MECTVVLASVVDWLLIAHFDVLAPEELCRYCRDLARVRFIHRWNEVQALRIDVGHARIGRLHFRRTSDRVMHNARVLMGMVRAANHIHGNIFGLEIPMEMAVFGEHVDDAELEMDRHLPRMRAAALELQQGEVDNEGGVESLAGTERASTNRTRAPGEDADVESFSDVDEDDSVWGFSDMVDDRVD